MSGTPRSGESLPADPDFESKMQKLLEESPEFGGSGGRKKSQIQNQQDQNHFRESMITQQGRALIKKRLRQELKSCKLEKSGYKRFLRKIRTTRTQKTDLRGSMLS